MKNQRMSRGFSLVEVMIVVAIIALLAAISIPILGKAREASQKNACIANLKQIDSAKATWAEQEKAKSGDKVPFSGLFGEKSYLKFMPQCPATSTPYTIGVVGEKPTCDYPGHTL